MPTAFDYLEYHRFLLLDAPLSHSASIDSLSHKTRKMASSSSNAEKILFRASDAMVFSVDNEIAVQFQPVKQLLAATTAVEQPLPLPGITSRTLCEIIRYLKKHTEEPNPEALKKFDSIFTSELEKDQKVLFEVLEAAYRMRIVELKDLLCTKVANMMAGKSPKEIREVFHIHNDLTREEEEAIRRANPWAFP